MTAEEWNQTLLNTCEACRADERAKMAANRLAAFSDEEIDYLLGCIDATGDPYQYEIAHELGAEQQRRQEIEEK